MDTVKNIIIFLLSISIYSCQSKTQTIRYETSMGFPIEKERAENYPEVYKKIFLLGNDIHKVEYRLGNDSDKLFMVLHYGKNKDEALVEYPHFKVDNFGNRFIFIKRNNISDYSFQIFNEGSKEFVSHYLFSDKGWIVGCEELGMQSDKTMQFYPNGKFTKKFLYDAKFSSILECDFENKFIKLYKPESFLYDEPQLVEKFSLEEFNKMKEKYFPYDDISYYSQRHIEPTEKQVSEIKKFIAPRKHKSIEYHTAIRTLTDENRVKVLEKYSKCFYKNGVLMREEFYVKNVLESVDYYYEGQFNETISTFNYRKIERIKKENYTVECQVLYKNNQIIEKRNIARDLKGRIIGIEKIEKDSPDYSETKKFLYNKQGSISGIFFYDSKGKFKNAELIKNEMLFLKPNIVRSIEDLKNGYFYNMDLSYYLLARL